MATFWTRSSASLRSFCLSLGLQIWWGLEQNTYFPALLAPASVFSSPQAGPHLISGMIRIFWGHFGAHRKWWQCWDHGLLGNPRSIKENYCLRSIFLNWALQSQSDLFVVYWMLKFRLLDLTQLWVTHLIHFSNQIFLFTLGKGVCRRNVTKVLFQHCLWFVGMTYPLLKFPWRSLNSQSSRWFWQLHEYICGRDLYQSHGSQGLFWTVHFQKEDLRFSLFVFWPLSVIW